jgi:hypothetical protein
LLGCGIVTAGGTSRMRSTSFGRHAGESAVMVCCKMSPGVGGPVRRWPVPLGSDTPECGQVRDLQHGWHIASDATAAAAHSRRQFR